MNSSRSILPLLLLCWLLGCVEAEDPEAAVATAATAAVEETPIAVKVKPVEMTAFPLRTISSGTLEAARQVVLKAPAGGRIIQLRLAEGQAVSKGQLLLQLDDQDQQLQLQRSRLQLEEALVTKQDLIVSNGGQAEVDTSVSPQKLEFILISSGYKQALHAIEASEIELAKTRLYAPFGGVAAEVDVRLHQQINTGEPLARLLDPASFEVIFPLLETEAVHLRKGQRVRVRPVALPELDLPAEISGWNPVVNEQGLVDVHARLRTRGSRSLFEGMKVEVILERMLPQQLVVPKSAVVLRSDREVVFSYDPAAHLAKWNYVRIGHQNDEAVAVAEGLEPDMQIIYDGNLNLAHDAVVKIAE